MNRIKKPKSCSECGSKRIAEILHGMPAFPDELERDIELGKKRISDFGFRIADFVSAPSTLYP
jgi:hypothetical protein